MISVLRLSHYLGSVSLAFFVTSCTSCLDQYDPRKVRQQLHDERQVANAPHVTLTETGELPSAGGAPQVSIDERYATLCAGCHGADGGGDGPAGAALNPKPRNLQDATWQANTAEARIYQVIKEGGAAVGLSATMAPWGSVLSDDEIKSMVSKVRTFKK